VWNVNQLTSTALFTAQFDMGNHNRAISLDNGDILRISGRNAYYDRIKLLVAPYKHTVGVIAPRGFGSWTPMTATCTAASPPSGWAPR